MLKKEKEIQIEKFVNKIIEQFPELKEDLKYTYDEKEEQFIIKHHNFELQFLNTLFHDVVRELTINILYKNEVLNFCMIYENPKDKIVERDKAIEIILNKIKEVEKYEFENIYMSKRIMKANEIKDCIFNNIFLNPSLKGWFVFQNPCTIANWAHECYYYLVINENLILKKEGLWFPSCDDMELISGVKE